MLNITKGNSKMGAVHNISLPPGVTCRAGAPCLKACYARKHCYARREAVREAWDENYAIYCGMGPSAYFRAIGKYLKRVKKPGLFRFHVGGDIPDVAYMTQMIQLAKAHPQWRFLAFTKQFEIVYLVAAAWPVAAWTIPENLRIVLSMWPGMAIPYSSTLKRRFPIAWTRDPKNLDNRIPESAKECPGTCDTCGLCWNMKKGESVVFDIH